jgi:type II secretory pathway pseudopilin PulG
MLHHPDERRRRAFTLVEMLVAAALILFMMWIISTAFQKGLESFRVLKVAGDMQEKLRAAATIIRRDLTRPHFEKVESEGWGGENLSDQRLDLPSWQPPTQGYFRIYQQGVGAVDGPDPDDPTMIHYHSPTLGEDIGHVLQFTTKLRGIRRDQYFVIDTRDLGADSVYGPPNAVGNGRLSRFNFPVYNRRVVYPILAADGSGLNTNVDSPISIFTTIWAEVVYFVRPNGEFAGSTPLYNLYRQQNLLVTDLPEAVEYITRPSPRPVEIDATSDNYREVSAWRTGAPTAAVNGPKTVTPPLRRIGVDPTSPVGRFTPISLRPLIEQLGNDPNHPLAGSDLLLTNVTNFEIKVLWEPASGGSGPQPFLDAPSNTVGNPDFPFDRIPPGNRPGFDWSTERIFDTWSKRETAPDAPDDYRDWNTPRHRKSIPIRLRVRALQIELRIWDVKSQQSRQITIIQDL